MESYLNRGFARPLASAFLHRNFRYDGGMAASSSSDFLALVLFGVAGVNALLGGIVLWHHRQEEHLAFSLTAFFVAIWTLTNALFRLSSSSSSATLWAQLSYVAALGTAAAFLHFAWNFPLARSTSLRGGSRFARTCLWSTGALVSVLSFVPGAVIQGVDIHTKRIETAPGVYLVALFILATSVDAFTLFWHNQAHLRGRKRAQARLVLYGSALTAIFGLFFNLLLPLLGDYRWVGLGPLSSLFFVGFSAYAIVAQRLFDVRLLIRRTFVYSLMLAVLAGSFAVLEKGTEHFLLPLLGQSHSFSSDLFGALLVGFAADPLKRWLRHLAASRLFQGEEEDGDARSEHPMQRTFPSGQGTSRSSS